MRKPMEILINCWLWEYPIFSKQKTILSGWWVCRRSSGLERCEFGFELHAVLKVEVQAMPRPGHNPSDSSEHHPDIPEPPEPAQTLQWKLYRTFIWADTWGEMMGRCSTQNDDGKKFHMFFVFLYPVSSRNVEVENNPLQKWIEMRNFTHPDYRRPEFFLWIISTRWTNPEGLPVADQGCSPTQGLPYRRTWKYIYSEIAERRRLSGIKQTTL